MVAAVAVVAVAGIGIGAGIFDVGIEVVVFDVGIEIGVGEFALAVRLGIGNILSVRSIQNFSLLEASELFQALLITISLIKKF